MTAISAHWCRLPGPDARKPLKTVARRVLPAQTGAIEIAAAVVNAWAMAASGLQVPVLAGWVGPVARHLADPMLQVREAATRIASAAPRSLIP
jgi:hypothetical protein